MRTIGIVMCSGLLALSVACGGGETPQPTTPTSAPSSGAGSWNDQVAAGQKLYGEHCASCHGNGGEGVKAPRVVGLSQGALPLDPPAGAKYRKTQFHTAADVADFVVHSMPPGGAGSLPEKDYWAILAFDLHANGVDLPKPIDGSNAKDVVIHK